jgi:hypothetical protein
MSTVLDVCRTDAAPFRLGLAKHKNGLTVDLSARRSLRGLLRRALPGEAI